MSSLKPINRSRLELIDESKGWTPGAFVKGATRTASEAQKDDGITEEWSGGLGTIIAVLDEGISVLWSEKPSAAGYFHAPYIPLQVTPTLLTSDVKKRKGMIERYKDRKLKKEYFGTIKLKDIK